MVTSSSTATSLPKFRLGGRQVIPCFVPAFQARCGHVSLIFCLPSILTCQLLRESDSVTATSMSRLTHPYCSSVNLYSRAPAGKPQSYGLLNLEPIRPCPQQLGLPQLKADGRWRYALRTRCRLMELPVVSVSAQSFVKPVSFPSSIASLHLDVSDRYGHTEEFDVQPQSY